MPGAVSAIHTSRNSGARSVGSAAILLTGTVGAQAVPGPHAGARDAGPGADRPHPPGFTCNDARAGV